MTRQQIDALAAEFHMTERHASPFGSPHYVHDTQGAELELIVSREILRPVIASNAHGFVVMHNHPSGDPTPSRADETVTRRLSEAATLMQVYFADHVINGQPSPGRSPYFSFREAGLVG